MNIYPPLFETSSLEYQAKLILSRAENTDVKYGNFCKDFARYTRNVAGVRDAGDRLTKDLHKFTESLTDSPGTRPKLEEFISLFAAVNDQEHARIKRLQSKVVAGFSKYGFICHAIKDEIDKSLSIREHEHQTAEEFSKLQAKFVGNYHLHQQRQDNLKTAINDTRRAQDLLKNEADKFERQKVNDLQQVLMNFCEIELTFHTRLIELYTDAYNVVKFVRPESDLDHFRNSITKKDPAAMKTKVGISAVPVHVSSMVRVETPSSPTPGDETVTDKSDTEDTKEFAVTSDDEPPTDRGAATTPDPASTKPESDLDKEAEKKTRNDSGTSLKKRRVSRTGSGGSRNSKPEVKSGRSSSKKSQPLTEDQIRRYANHFSVHASEYSTESEHDVAEKKADDVGRI